MRSYRIAFVTLLLSLPFGVFAESGLLDSSSTLAELNLLIAQYEARIKKVEAENAVLRFQMAKAGIQVPMEDLSGSTLLIPTTLPGNISKTSSGVSVVTPKDETISSTTLSEITSQYGKDVAGFISRVNKDWTGIKSNYSFPLGAHIAGYEFVQTGSQDHVFVDIVVGTGTTGIYDAKILYQFEKSEYKRKLIGIFDYSATTNRYTTRVGSNPFGGVSRTFIRDPYFTGVVKTPSTVISTNTGTISSASPVTNPTAATTVGTVSLADVTKAYNEKRYLSTITLSNTYLANNPANQEILNIRYRTYFIIGKYSESLAELAKIEKLGTLDKQTACNAQVIATYSKNQTLVDKYATICKK